MEERENLELGNMMSYVQQNNEQLFYAYMKVLQMETQLTDEFFDDFYNSILTFLLEVEKNHKEYKKMVNADLFLSKIYSFWYNNPKYKLIFGTLTPKYKEALKLEYKLLDLLYKYQSTIYLDNNQMDLSDIYLILSTILVIQGERHKEYLRQVSISEELIENPRSAYTLKDFTKKDVINFNINYVEGRIKEKTY